MKSTHQIFHYFSPNLLTYISMWIMRSSSLSETSIPAKTKKQTIIEMLNKKYLFT